MSFINWNHPEVEKLISDYTNNRPEALSQIEIAQAVSAILNRDVSLQEIQWRITTLRTQQSSQLQLPQLNESSKFTNSAPYLINMRKQTISKEMSNISILEDFIEKMNELQNQWVSLISAFKHAAITAKNAFASSENLHALYGLNKTVNLENQDILKLQLKQPQPNLSSSAPLFNNVQRKLEMPNELFNATRRSNILNTSPMNASDIMNRFFASSENFMGKSQRNENQIDQVNLQIPQENGLPHKPALRKINLKAGLNSKLYTCLILEENGKFYEYSFVFEENGNKHYKCEHCSSLGSSTKNNGSYIKVFIDGKLNVGDHIPKCNPQTKFVSDMVQTCRQERVAAAQSHHMFENGLEIVSGKFFEFRPKDGIPNAELNVQNRYKYVFEESQNIYFCCECHNVTAKLHIKKESGEMFVTLGKNGHQCNV